SQPFQPRILLVGDPAARPEGLERFLVRGGFQVTEAAYPVPGADRAEAQPPDLLIFASGGREARLGDAVRDLATSSRFAGAPLIVLLADGGAEAVGDALQAGAPDAPGGPVPLRAPRARSARAPARRVRAAPAIALRATGGAGAVGDALQAGARAPPAGPVPFGERPARMAAGRRRRGELKCPGPAGAPWAPA